MRRYEAHPGLAKFFGGLVRRSFTELGLRNSDVTQYVVNLLARFARTDALYRVSDLKGKRLETVVEMLMDAQGVPASPGGVLRERDVRQHIGDYTLFMSGIFRSYVERQGFLGFYLESGERAYRDTARLDRQLYREGAGCFEAMASDFERLSGGLDYMRKVYFHSAVHRSPFPELVERFSVWN